VCRHDEECVVLGDAIVGQTVEEGGERVVIGLELRLIVGLPWPGGAWKVGIERRGKRRGVVVMSVRDVGVGHRHAGFLHLGDISEGVLGKGPVESRETAATERVGDGSTTRVVYADIVVGLRRNRKSTRLNSSHLVISYAVFCLKKKI